QSQSILRLNSHRQRQFRVQEFVRVRVSGSFQFRRHRRVEAGSEANALPCRRIDLREVLQRQNQSLNELWADDPLPMSQITIPSSSLVLSERSQPIIYTACR